MTKTAKMGFWGTFAFAVLVLSVTRGLVPLLTGNASLAEPTYTLSAFLGVLLSLYGLYLALFKKTPIIPKTLRLLLLINFALHVLWLIPTIAFRPDINTMTTGLIYTGLYPFAIIVLVRLPERYLVKSLVMFTFLVSGTVILDFIELNTLIVPHGYNSTLARHALLRSSISNLEGFGYTDVVYRAVGIFGHRPHDAAIFLAMLTAYWLQMLIQAKGSRLFFSILVFTAMIGMLMTQVASNILAFLVGTVFIALANPRQFLRVAGVRFLSAALIISGSLVYLLSASGLPIDLLWKWRQRVSMEGDWATMLRFDVSHPLSDIFSFFVGHGLSLEMSTLGNSSEFAFVQMLMEYGVFHWIILMCILTYPIWRYVAIRHKSKLHALPYIGALVVGFISLWHYASVLHTTSIFLMFALYAQALRSFADAKLSCQPIKRSG